MTLTKLLAAAALTPLLAAAPPPSDASAVRLNQAGLLPDGVKMAIAASPSREPLEWRLVDGDERVLASGTTRIFGPDRWSGDHVHQVDFSSFRQPGAAYALNVGTLWSRPFDISPDIYEQLPYDALAYFYHNRAGTPIEARFVGELWSRPAGQPARPAPNRGERVIIRFAPEKVFSNRLTD